MSWLFFWGGGVFLFCFNFFEFEHFFHVVYWLFWYVLFVPICCSKIVLFPCHPAFGKSSCILPLPAGRIFLSLFWNVLFYLYYFILSWYLFSLSFFTSTFWFVSSSFIVCFNSCIAFLFSSPHIPAFFLCLLIFDCCRFLISVSSLISHPGFEFLFVLYRGTQILSQTTFAPA